MVVVEAEVDEVILTLGRGGNGPVLPKAGTSMVTPCPLTPAAVVEEEDASEVFIERNENRRSACLDAWGGYGRVRTDLRDLDMVFAGGVSGCGWSDEAKGGREEERVEVPSPAILESPLRALRVPQAVP